MLRGEDPRDPFEIDPCKFEEPFDLVRDRAFFPGGFGPLLECDSDEDGLIDFVTAEPANVPANLNAIHNIRVAVDGAFKTPGLRNIELTGPFMHNDEGCIWSARAERHRHTNEPPPRTLQLQLVGLSRDAMGFGSVGSSTERSRGTARVA